MIELLVPLMSVLLDTKIMVYSGLEFVKNVIPNYDFYIDIGRFFMMLIFVLFMCYLKFYKQMTIRTSNLTLDLVFGTIALIFVGAITYVSSKKKAV